MCCAQQRVETQTTVYEMPWRCDLVLNELPRREIATCELRKLNRCSKHKITKLESQNVSEPVLPPENRPGTHKALTCACHALHQRSLKVWARWVDMHVLLVLGTCRWHCAGIFLRSARTSKYWATGHSNQCCTRHSVRHPVACRCMLYRLELARRSAASAMQAALVCRYQP